MTNKPLPKNISNQKNTSTFIFREKILQLKKYLFVKFNNLIFVRTIKQP